MANELQQSIDDMLAGLKTAPVPEEESEPVEEDREDATQDVVEGEEEEESGEEVQEPEEAVVEEEEAEPVEETAEEEGEEVVEDAEGGEEDEATALRNQINAMSSLLLKHGISLPGDGGVVEPIKETPKAAQPTPQPPPQPQQMSLEELRILADGIDFDDMMENKETFEKGMRQMLANFATLQEQRFTRAIPTIVATQVSQLNTLHRAVDEFYTKNPDLAMVRPTVGMIANQIVAEHPEFNLEQVMEEAATRTRKALRLPGLSRASKKKVITPSFAKAKGTNRKPKPKISKLQQEIDELL